ncbi:hypothetical protein KBC04_00570 [Candidatus Babeliales bacterium]|nr:hypothetical protein [Candidatus Babeliales bacterium]MBP9843415.1 hypothetical protein [Candidatus Babeliales bacterium]
MKKLYAIFYLSLATNLIAEQTDSLLSLQQQLQRSKQELASTKKALGQAQDNLKTAQKNHAQEIQKHKNEIMNLLQTVAQATRAKRVYAMTASLITATIILKYFPPIL